MTHVRQTSMTFKVLEQIKKGSLMRIKQKLEHASVSKVKPGQCIIFP